MANSLWTDTHSESFGHTSARHKHLGTAPTRAPARSATQAQRQLERISRGDCALASALILNGGDGAARSSDDVTRPYRCQRNSDNRMAGWQSSHFLAKQIWQGHLQVFGMDRDGHQFAFNLAAEMVDHEGGDLIVA